MADILTYKNQLWKRIQHFDTAGSYKFSLDPGKYLFLCRGAKGGKHYTLGSYQNIGGTSIGEINLTKHEEMYAYVGGDGGDAPPENSNNFVPGGAGGFNGGGAGGNAPNTGYSHFTAAGGGGASDIRLKSIDDFGPSPYDEMYTPQLPEGYSQVEYIETNGSQYFDTGYIAKTNTAFVFEAAQADVSNDMAFLGSQYDNGYGDGWVVWLSRNGVDYQWIASIYGPRNWSYSESPATGVAMNQKGLYQVDQWGSRVNGVQLIRYDFPTGRPQTDRTIILFGLRRSNNIDYRLWIGKLYYFRIYETDATLVPHLVREYIPCIHDGVAGLYETVTERFFSPIHYSGNTPLGTGPEQPYSFKNNDLMYRYYQYEIPEEYQLVDYIESNGKQYINTKYMLKQSDLVVAEVTLKPGEADFEHIFGIRQYVLDRVSNEYFAESRFRSAFTPSWSKSSNTQYAPGVIPQGVGDTENTRHIGLYMYRSFGALMNSAGVNIFQQQFAGNVSTIAPGPMFIFDINCCDAEHPELPGYIAFAGSYDVRPAHMFFHKLYVYDSSGNVVHAYLPCYRKSDNMAGILDVVDGSFYTNQYEDGEDFIVGSDISDPPKILYINKAVIDDREMQSLNTRIMVAGGGAGAWQHSGTFPASANMSALSGVGGGAIGGCTISANGGTHNLQSATQLTGYQFGKGENGTPATRYYHPSTGGGGGWFGGYAGDINSAGGGGSGYVLSESSYKPSGYMKNYQPYIFTNITMIPGSAEQSEICIYEPCTSIKTGDVITALQTGACERIELMPGRYYLKCYGGDGGVIVNPTFSARGGYSEGILNLNGPDIAFLYVAGSGLQSNMISHDYVHQINPTISFNGGGQPKTYGNNDCGMAGGGATDIRFGKDSLYSRIIVAGGGGGQTASHGDSRGGNGGGEVGGTGTAVGTMYGYHPGPGTQTGSPVEPACSECNGGFGYGGNMPTTSDSHYGPGAGGSGWFGGSSTYVPYTSGNNIRGGSGGSGYVLTEESYKPDGYLLGSNYYLTNALTVQGGNTLPVGVSKIAIEALSVNLSLILCRDMYGLKRYDVDNDTWVLLSDEEQTLDEATFVKYGTTIFSSDNGLADDYEIIVFDPDDVIESCNLNITPHEYIVTHETISNMKITNMKQNLSFDPNIFDITITGQRHILDDGNSKIITTFKIIKKIQSDDDLKIFYISYYDGN